jgi:hypothetical protein
MLYLSISTKLAQSSHKLTRNYKLEITYVVVSKSSRCLESDQQIGMQAHSNALTPSCL